jgi:hypothetical protein
MSLSPPSVAISVAILLQVFAIASGLAPVLGPDRELAGPDGYMRLLQVERLWAGGGWFDRFSPLTNAPLGETSHWTRPFDLLLLAGAWPLSFLVETGRALYWSGYLAGPALQLAAVAVLAWGLAPVLGRWNAAVAAMLFCTMPVLRGVFMAAQPDHHSLQMLLFVAVHVLTVRAALSGASPRFALGAGILSGTALWVGVEGLIATAAALATLGPPWLWRGGAGREEDVRRFLWGFAAMTAAAFLLDRPPAEWSLAEYDRISVVHLLLAAAMATGWEAARRMPFARWGKGLAATALAAGIVALTFPRFFGGPLVDIDPRLLAEWGAWIGEAQPLWPRSVDVGARLVFDLGFLPFALPALLRGLGPAADERDRSLAIACLALLAILLPLGLSQERLAAYPEAILAAPWARSLAILAGIPRLPALARGLAVAVALTGHLFVAAHLQEMAEKEGNLPPPRRNCPWARIAPTLKDLASREGRRLTILGYVHQGPEIAYRTGQAVVGSPYQRNRDGILDTHVVLRSTDMEEARRIVEARKIDLIVVCRSGSEAGRYRDRGDNLFRKALEGGEPPWLRRLPLPEGVADEFAVLERRSGYSLR